MLKSINSIYSEDILVFTEILNSIIRCEHPCMLTIIAVNWVQSKDIRAEYHEGQDSMDMFIKWEYTDPQLEQACKSLGKEYYKHLEKYHYKLTWHDEIMAVQYADAVWDLYKAIRKKQQVIRGALH